MRMSLSLGLSNYRAVTSSNQITGYADFSDATNSGLVAALFTNFYTIPWTFQ